MHANKEFPLFEELPSLIKSGLIFPLFFYPPDLWMIGTLITISFFKMQKINKEKGFQQYKLWNSVLNSLKCRNMKIRKGLIDESQSLEQQILRCCKGAF